MPTKKNKAKAGIFRVADKLVTKRRLRSNKKNIFEREHQSVFVQMLGAIFGFGRYK